MIRLNASGIATGDVNALFCWLVPVPEPVGDAARRVRGMFSGVEVFDHQHRDDTLGHVPGEDQARADSLGVLQQSRFIRFVRSLDLGCVSAGLAAEQAAPVSCVGASEKLNAALGAGAEHPPRLVGAVVLLDVAVGAQEREAFRVGGDLLQVDFARLSLSGDDVVKMERPAAARISTLLASAAKLIYQCVAAHSAPSFVPVV